jgi:hypothetical protein
VVTPFRFRHGNEFACRKWADLAVKDAGFDNPFRYFASVQGTDRLTCMLFDLTLCDHGIMSSPFPRGNVVHQGIGRPDPVFHRALSIALGLRKNPHFTKRDWMPK